MKEEAVSRGSQFAIGGQAVIFKCRPAQNSVHHLLSGGPRERVKCFQNPLSGGNHDPSLHRIRLEAAAEASIPPRTPQTSQGELEMERRGGCKFTSG